MSRPVNWQKRYEAVLKRHNRLYTKFTKLQQEMTAMKMKHTLEPRPPMWRRLMSPFLLIALLGGCASLEPTERLRVPLAEVQVLGCESKQQMDIYNTDRTRVFTHDFDCSGVYQGRTVPMQVSGTPSNGCLRESRQVPGGCQFDGSGDHVYIARKDLRLR